MNTSYNPAQSPRWGAFAVNTVHDFIVFDLETAGYSVYQSGDSERCEMAFSSETWLLDLGDTPERVALTLFNMGVRGAPGSVRDHPLVKAFTEQYPENANQLRCAHGRLTYGDFAIPNPRMTDATVQFIRRYARGDYPELFHDGQA